WALIERGRQEELLDQPRQEDLIEQMCQGLAAHRATGAEVLCPHFLALLAQALGKNGRADEAFHLLEEALLMADANGERCYKAELYRAKGEMLVLKSAHRGRSRAATSGMVAIESESLAVAQAEECFHQSIKLAERQGARSWELRAAMSLARLYQNQGKQREARAMLDRIYTQFTEGFDTKDLQEAKALLDELSKSSAGMSGRCLT
ncbi:MAG TPA: hypothetical protein VFV34_25725, partial [Blastocatellia bacterium]|nr:hypothetical protein [Blastocatellia bacterium]